MHYLIYKPYGMLSQFSPEGTERGPNKPTLADLDFAFERDVYPVGRLDADSEGLLLLTADTRVNHRLLDPRHAHPRTYYVQVDGAITEQALVQLAEGVLITVDRKPHRTLPAQVRRLAEPALPPRNPPVRYRASIPTSWVELTLTEGKNRQVRRMTAAVGFPTLRLVRWAIGLFTAEDMHPGQVRLLPDAALQQLLKTHAEPPAGVPLRPRKRW